MTYISHLNPNINVTREYWAVTMICNAKSSSSNRPAIFSGDSHALLVIERVKKTGELFREVVHFTGPGAYRVPENRVMFLGYPFCAIHNRVGDVLFVKKDGGYHIQDVRYTHKSETWLRTADKVRAMRREAKLERDNPTTYPRPFCIFGDRSVLTKDLETFKITDPLIAALAYCDKRLFLKLFDRVLKCRDGRSPGIERLHERYFNPLEDIYPYSPEGGYNIAKHMTFVVWDDGRIGDSFMKWLGAIRSFCWRDHISSNRYIEIADLFANTATSEDREQLIQSAPEHERKFFIEVRDRFEGSLKNHNLSVLSLFKKVEPEVISKYPALENRVRDFMNICEKDALLACRQIMWLIHKHASLCHIKPDSCFTWAREKLSLIDVQLNDVGLEHILSPTKKYLKKSGDTEQFVYINKLKQKFIISFKFKGAAITFEAKFVDSVKDSVRTIVDPILKDFSFELLSEHDPRFKIFAHINSKEFDQADQIFQKHLLFFQDCFQMDILIQLIISQNKPEYINYFDQKGLSFKYNGGDPLWFAYQEGATDAFEALVKTPHMNLRVTDPETGKTLLHALVGNSSIVSDPGLPLVPKFTHDALVHSFCQEFKQRYPESFKDFLNQKISTENPINALDIAVDHHRRWAAQFLIEEGADFEEKIDYWFNGLWSDRYINESVEGDPDGGSPYVYYSESSSFSFIRKVMSWEFERQISPSLKIELLKCCCTFFHEKGKRDYYFTPPRNLMAEAQHLVKRHILPYPKKNFRDSDNNGLLMIVLKMGHDVLTSSNSYESKPMCRSLRLELLKLLLSGSYPDDIDQANNEGETPLIYAAKHDYDLLYFFLRKTECSVNQQDLQGNTALHYAIIAGGKRRREVLIRHKKINPNIRNRLGQTPLHLTWDRDVIRLLLHAGADPNIKDNEGRTPRDIHEQNDPRLIVRKFLESYGL